MARRCLVGLSALALVTLACSTATPHHHTVHGGSPLQTGQLFAPFPNAWFEQPGAKTATGYQIIIPDSDLPVTSTGVGLDTSILGQLDGFSPSTQLVVYFPQGVDPTQLTPTATSPYDGAAGRIQFMSRPDSPIVLIDVTTRERVPIFAELDANLQQGVPKQQQALLIHPMVRLKNATRYAVAILTSLHDTSGQPLQPEGQFADWAQGKLKPSEELWEISDRLDQDATAFAALGIPKSALALAWDFDTASDASTTGQLQTMVSEALATTGHLGYTVQTAQPDPTNFPNASSVVIGTFQSPSFETGADPSPLHYDQNHTPIMGAPADWRFVAVIPKCAATAPGPVPLLVIGHGLFGTAWTELSDDDKAGLMQTLCMVAIGTNWVGLSGNGSHVDGEPPDEPKDFTLLPLVLTDPNQFDLVTGRLQQGHVNFQVLARLAKGAMASDPSFVVNGHAAYDPSKGVYYWGASNGGIQGATYLSLSNDVGRGVLNVPGAAWSLLMWRSYDFFPAFLILQGTYPDPLDMQLVMNLTQSMWDKTDPIEFAPHMVGTDKQVLFQESEGDAEVNNITTRTEMRTLGATPVAPLLERVYDLTPKSGPLTGLVYEQWSVDPSPLPPFADSPSPDNLAHDTMRWIPQIVAQTKRFLQPSGTVTSACPEPGSPCISYPDGGFPDAGFPDAGLGSE